MATQMARAEQLMGWAMTAYIATFTVCFTIAFGKHFYGLALLVGFMFSLPFAQLYNFLLNSGANKMMEAGRDPARMIVGSSLWLCGVTAGLTKAWFDAQSQPNADPIWMIYAYIGAFIAVSIAFSIGSAGSHTSGLFGVQGTRGVTTPPPPKKQRLHVGLGSLFQGFTPRPKVHKPTGTVRETKLGKELFDQIRTREK
jgi:hypothetical protein